MQSRDSRLRMDPRTYDAIKKFIDRRVGPVPLRAMMFSFFDILYGYSERACKILVNWGAAIFVFAFCYYFVSQLGPSYISVDSVSGREGLWKCVYFSAATCVTLGYGSINCFGFCRVLAVLEALLTVVMAALFVHSLARKTGGR
jgi:hypothetical protein